MPGTIKRSIPLKKHNIRQIGQISELYAFASLPKTPDHEDFDMLYFSDLQRGAKKMLPPHRRSFFTIIFFEDQKSGQISINEKQHQNLTNAVLFQGQEHIFSFVRDDQVKGSILLFTPSFLLPHMTEIEFRFPFFSLLSQNLFHLSTKEQQEFSQILSVVHAEKQQKETVKYLVLALLEKCLSLYQTYSKEEKYVSRKYLLVRQFKQLVNNYFHTEKQVDFYATQLNVTANHLSEVIKSQTNKTAKRHIMDRVLLEAKNLLNYTDMDATEIAYALNFSEATHFNRFFKKETQTTPRIFRQQNR